jgi:hypothetical protein
MFPHHGEFTCFIIISDKPNDLMINGLLPLIYIRVMQINYDHGKVCLMK